MKKPCLSGCNRLIGILWIQVAAVTTFEYMGRVKIPPWLSEKSACRAFKAFRPADTHQMTCASLFIGELGHALDCATKGKPVATG